MQNPEINGWPRALEETIQEVGPPFERVRVYVETDSTQDIARRERAGSGTLIVAGRQTRGRGRLGSAWADTAHDGVAMTLVLPRERGERFAFAFAVALARAAEQWLGPRVRIKWPNDLLVDGRKLAGILIEQTGAHALIGIGVNVAQTSWPRELDQKAVSLTQLGAPVSRLEVMQRLIVEVARALALEPEALMKAYAARDGLRGRTVTVLRAGREFHGQVRSMDLRKGLTLETPEGDSVQLPAMESRLLSGSHSVRASSPDTSA